MDRRMRPSSSGVAVVPSLPSPGASQESVIVDQAAGTNEGTLLTHIPRADEYRVVTLNRNQGGHLVCLRGGPEHNVVVPVRAAA
jgi:hypothetical protein